MAAANEVAGTDAMKVTPPTVSAIVKPFDAYN
jgi:hypothetical protein